MQPSYYEEENLPKRADCDSKLAHKIAGSLYELATSLSGGVPVTDLLEDIKGNTARPTLTKITDGAGVVNTKQLGTQLVGSEVGLVTNTIIHGLTTGGGGGYVDVKVNPSGALTVEATVSSSALPSGASTSANQITGNSYLEQLAAVRAPEIAYNGAGRARTADPVKVFDGRIDGSRNALIWEQVGTGTFTQSNNEMQMSVTSGQYCIWKSKRYMPYFSGSPTTVEETMYRFAPQADATKRAGYFSSNNAAPYQSNFDGFFVQSSSGTISFNVYNYGTAIVNALPITSWSGYSKLGAYQNLATWDFFTVVEWEFLWLGGAILLLKVKTPTGWVIAHQFDYAGTAEGTMMRHASQPLRYELVSSTGTANFRYVCSQCSTDGEVSGTGYRRIHKTNPASAIVCASIGTTYPIIGVRPNATYRHTTIEVVDFSLFVGSTADIGYVSVQLNPTLSAPLSWSNVANSSVQTALGNGTITVTSTGSEIAGGFLSTNSILPNGTLSENFLAWLGMSIADVPDEVVLCLTPSTATINTYGTLSTEER